MLNGVWISLICNEAQDANKAPPLDTKRKHRDFKQRRHFVTETDKDSVRVNLTFHEAH